MRNFLKNPMEKFRRTSKIFNSPTVKVNFKQSKMNQLSNLLQNPEERYAKVLNKVCGPETRGQCVDFGFYRNDIDRFFNYFDMNKNMKYIKSIKQIGEQSVNGSIYMFTYTKEGYSAYSVFKINQNSWSDSLVYEYFVGKTFINKYLNIFPCFVETYNMYVFYSDFKTFTSSSINTEKLKALQHMSKVQNDFALSEIAKKSCEHGRKTNLGILIQHYDNLKNIESIYDIFTIYQLLFQVYFCLHVMKNNFTHYDLHAGNALMYKPYIGKKYVVMNYHFNDGSIVKFPTEQIMKIIDYGRCHFNHEVNGKTESTMDIVNGLCADTTKDYTTDPCYSKLYNNDEVFCGETFGMGSVFGENVFDKTSNKFSRRNGSFYYINPATKNVSHDLALLNYINEKYKMGINVNYETKNGLGTPEIESVSWTNTSPSDTIIQNVTDAALYLKKEITELSPIRLVEWITGTPSSNTYNNKYGMSEGWEKMGEFHIYEDQRDYEFTSR